MKDLFRLIHLIAPYLVIPILSAGLFKWKNLSTPFRIFIIGAALSSVISLIKAHINDQNVGFYLSALVGVTVYAFLLQSILSKIINTTLIWLGVATIWIIIG